MNQEDIQKPKVAIIHSETPQECLSSGLEKLGGIKEFIKEGDVIFLKISLRYPSGFPSNINMNLVGELIRICKKSSPKKIYVGAYPTEKLSLSLFNDILGLKDFFKNMGGEFVFLDNSDVYNINSNNSDTIENIKNETIKKINIEDMEVEIPKIVLDSDKIININQVNVSPLNICSLSLENQFTILPNNYRDLYYTKDKQEDIVKDDLYQKDLTKKILDTYLIKKPILTINDIFYILEGAGPYVYKDSNLKNTNLLVLGTDSVAVDVITLMLMNIDTSESNILVEAVDREIGPKLMSDIQIIGENLEESSFQINQCKNNLEDIRIQNLHTHCGKMCSGCFLKAYHFLNILKSYLIKDLKYIGKNNLLVGLNPPEVPTEKNIILFGDCAIKSTNESNFRTLIKKTLIRKNEKEVKNKKILEISGCPPDLYQCFQDVKNYFGKKSLPNLDYILKLFDKSGFIDSKKNLSKWEELNSDD